MGCRVDSDLCDDQDDNRTLNISDEGANSLECSVAPNM